MADLSTELVRLEDLADGTRVRGVIPEKTVSVVQVAWHGDIALTLTYRDDQGTVGEQILYRDDEARLELEAETRPWIGDRFEREEMKPLHRAVVAALLDPLPLAMEKKEDTQGWSIPTSDNALVYLHQLDGSGHVSIEYGRMVTTMVSGLTIGEEHSQIHGPSELHAPFLGHDPDPVYLGALFAELTAGTTQARRLGRAIESLDLAGQLAADDPLLGRTRTGEEAREGTSRRSEIPCQSRAHALPSR